MLTRGLHFAATAVILTQSFPEVAPASAGDSVAPQSATNSHRSRVTLTTVVILLCHNTQHDHFTHSHHALPRGIRPSPACFPSFTKHPRRGNGGERTCQPKSPSHFRFRTAFVSAS